jgi:hypothetical protein
MVMEEVGLKDGGMFCVYLGLGELEKSWVVEKG